MKSNDGVILTSTLWNQSGKIRIPVDGVQTILNVTYNQFCPLLSADSTTRCVTGCTNTADSQILYYWIERGYDLNLTATASDYLLWKGDGQKYYMSDDPALGMISLTDLNELLSGDVTKKLQDGDFIAALNFYCGIKNHSSYGDSTSTGTTAVAAFKGAGFDSYYHISSSSKTPLFADGFFTEVGFSILRENLDYGEVIRVGIPGHAIYMDGYRYNESTGKYEYHLNYGWGVSSSSTKWYTIEQLKNEKITYVKIDISPDIKVTVTNDASEYRGGSFLRGVERINGIKNDKSTTFSFEQELAGKSITLTDQVKFTSQVDVEFGNWCVNMRSTAVGGIYSVRDLSFDLNSGSIAVSNADAKTTAVQARKLDVDLSNSWIYAGSSSDFSSITSAVQSGKGITVNNFSRSFLNSAAGKALTGGSKDDSVVLTGNSAIFGSVDLGGGKNTVTVDNGSMIYGTLLGEAASLSLNMIINDTQNHGAMVVADSSVMESSLLAATGGVINVVWNLDIIYDTFVLVDGYSSGTMDDFTVVVEQDGNIFEMNSTNSYDGYFEVFYSGGDLVLEYKLDDLVKIYSGSELIASYHEFSGALIQGRSMYLYERGKAFDSLISGAEVYVQGGTFSRNNVNNGGRVYVSNGGSALDNEISASGEMYVTDGTACNTTVDSNGSMHVSDGGTVSNTTINTGGSMYIAAGSTHYGTLQIKAGANVTVEQGGTIDFTIAGRSSTDGYVINDLALISGAPDYTVTVSATQENGVYKLAQGADDFTGVITLGDGVSVYGVLTANGDVISYDSTDYKLTLSAGYLMLEIGDDLVPPELDIVCNITQMTNNNVVLTALSSDGAVQYYDGAKWVDGNRLTVEQNGVYKFRATDSAGNVNEQHFTVDNIDKTPPENPWVIADESLPTNKNVTVSASFSDDSTTRQYSFDGKNWIDYTGEIVFEKNGTVYFQAIDSVGNISETVRYEVSNIDKIAPNVPAVWADVTSLTGNDVMLTVQFSDDSVAREYSFDNLTWQSCMDTVAIAANCTVYFRGIDAAGNCSKVASYRVNNIDKAAPVLPETYEKKFLENQYITLDWADAADVGIAGVGGYYIRYGNSPDLSGSGEFVADSSAVLSDLTLGKYFYQIKAVDNIGNESAWTNVQALYIVPHQIDNLHGSVANLSWEAVAQISDYMVKISTNDFNSAITLQSVSESVDLFMLPRNTYQWQVSLCDVDNSTSGNEIISNNRSNKPQMLISDADGDLDLFFAVAKEKWSWCYFAQHQCSVNGWEGTGEQVALEGKNRFSDVFIGSSDANILVLSDESNGDALFADDIYSAFGDQARIVQINEIRAGAGDDIVDMTSRQFEYVGSGVTIYGGAGDDVIWANNSSNTLYGDAGNDRIIGGAGDDVIVGGAGNDVMHGGGGYDVFCFGGNWGNDIVEQLADGKVVLWFEEGSIENWDNDTFTYTDGKNSVTLVGADPDNVVIRFTPFFETAVAGAFLDAASEKIFEDKDKGMLA